MAISNASTNVVYTWLYIFISLRQVISLHLIINGSKIGVYLYYNFTTLNYSITDKCLN